jgi:hypothetical protein
LTKAFVYDALIIHMGKVPQQTVIVMTAAAATIFMWVSTVAMAMIPQAAYAQQDEVNPPLSSSVDSCASDESPASVDGETKCIGEGECESYEFEGKEVKHCDY